MAIRRAVDALGAGNDLPEGFWYLLKRRLLGPPMVNQQLGEQRLSKKIALGVLSPDGISSSAYGTEEILIELVQFFAFATAFTLLLPLTGVVLFVMVLVVLSYREIVTVYTRAGGSYVVARENFGPRIAQIAAVALLIDYVVTVGVQISAGTAAIASAVPEIGPYTREISIGIILLMCFGNLRGIREAGNAFALPTYLFSGVVILMIVVGLFRAGLGTLPVQNLGPIHGQIYHQKNPGAQLTAFAVAFTLLRAFANGGSSLTGIEAVSNAVSAFKPPEGINARRVLVLEGLILGSLVAGISVLAYLTHATPYKAGYPTVISQEANLVFGSAGHFMFYVVQGVTALILYTGGNTSFNGFPFLTNFVAEDSFLPRWMTKRGHRLVFSNGIIVLTVFSVTLILVFGANVNNLVPLYAIGVFTAFSMAGFGMARYHRRRREPGWRHKLVINFSAGVLTGIVVLIFAVVKFTEGAWLIVVLFPVLVFALIRLNREYRMESQVLEAIGERRAAGEPPREPNYTRRVVFLFVDSVDLATLAALRYARSLRPTTLRGVHFVIDDVRAERIRERWVQLVKDVPLDFIDVADRRLLRATEELVSREAEQPGTQVTVVLPRRSFAPLMGRLLHDRTADKMAGVVSRIPHSAATIVPFDVESRVQVLQEHQAARVRPVGDGRPTQAADTPGRPPAGVAAGGPGDGTRGPETAGSTGTAGASGTASTGDQNTSAVSDEDVSREKAGNSSPEKQEEAGEQAVRSVRKLGGLLKGRDGSLTSGDGRERYDRPVPPDGVNPIGSLHTPGRAVVEGRVHTLEIRPVERNSVLACEISDSTGDLTALFYGRSHIPGVICGSRVRFRGPVGIRDGAPIMVNPAYELLGSGGTASDELA